MEILGGPLFAVAGAGESHGPAVTTIVLGCPPGLEISRALVQPYLDRRRPGGNRHGTPRQERDMVLFLSGLYLDDHETLTAGPEIGVAAGEKSSSTKTYDAGVTTGEPISAIVLSTSKKSGHYDQFMGLAGAVRPGHTDLVKYHKAEGYIDIRGGGRSSYRSTISDVIGGSIARLFLKQHFGTVFFSSISQVGALKTPTPLSAYLNEIVQEREGQRLTADEINAINARLEAAEIHTLDSEFAKEAGELIKQTRIAGDSLGAAVEVVAVNVPPLVGDPLYQSLKVRLMGTLGGLHAAQACEVGDGVEVISRRGSENNDPIRRRGYQKNSHGGLIGGMTTGSPLVCRVGFKPTSSIDKSQKSVRKNLEEIDFALAKGRHDPCVGVRAGITLESRMAIELMNGVLMHQARHLDTGNFELF